MLVRAVLLLAAAATSRPGTSVRVEHNASEMVRIPSGSFTMGFVAPTSLEEYTVYGEVIDGKVTVEKRTRTEVDATDVEVQELTMACVREFGSKLGELYCKEELLIEPALPARKVYLPAFDIDRYEVTVAQYRECAADGGCDVSALVAGDGRYVRDDSWPMVYVTWQDAADYCAWAGKRLPTEAEFEKAARGTDRRRWPWGDHERADGSNHGGVEGDVVRGPIWGSVNYVGDDADGYDGPAPPGAMKWTDSSYGVFDLSGNVSEWVADYYQENYAGLSAVDPVVDAAPDGGSVALRVYRGGSWAEPKLFGRTYFRLYAEPDQRSFDRGFRCARDAD